jgi:pyruvate dehydrogenase E2 component (dihydrolipoamide acetyltransferase)
MSIFASVAEAGVSSAAETARGTVERVEPTKAQRAAARRIAESKATAPHVYLDVEIGAEEAPPERIVRACALALREFPRLNGAYRDGAFEIYSRVNVGVAVAGAEGPVVVTVFDADRKSAAEIGAELDGLTRRAAAGELTSPELAGGTFTIVRAAVGSVRSVVAVLNQGQAAALGVGATAERAVVREGRVVPGRALTATLSCDGRMVDASEGARFLDRVRELLEAPGGPT